MKRVMSAAMAALCVGLLAAVAWVGDGEEFDFGGDTSHVVDKPNLFLISEMPVRSKITSFFGPRLHPIFHRWIMHQGIDFRARVGTPIHNVLDGVVVHAGPRGGFGNAVYVMHPIANDISVYAHLSEVDVKVGDTVHQGQIVGKSGATGFATGAHLHFGVKNAEGKWIDPIAFLRKVPTYQLAALRQRVPEASVVALSAPLPKRLPTRKEVSDGQKYRIPSVATVVAPPVVAASVSPSALNASMLKAVDSPADLLKKMLAATQVPASSDAVSVRLP